MALTSESTRYATREEAHDAIRDLQKPDFAKLMLIARSFARKRRLNAADAEPEDLLQEAIAKTLDGRGRWSRKVSIVRHLDRVMESDSGHFVERRKWEAKRGHDHLYDPDLHRESASLEPSPASVRNRDALHDVLTSFAGDEQALQLIRLKGDDLSASEIRCQLGMSKTEYDTVTKRIRRRVANLSVE